MLAIRHGRPGCVPPDCRYLDHGRHRLRVRLEHSGKPRRESVNRAAQAHCIQQRIDRPHRRKQADGRLVTDPRHSGDAIGRVAAQDGQPDVLFRCHAESLHDPGRIEQGPALHATVRREVESNSLGDKLHHVAVPTCDDDIVRLARGQRANEVIGLEPVRPWTFQAECIQEFGQRLGLGRERVWHLLGPVRPARGVGDPVRLVGRKHVDPPLGAPVLVPAQCKACGLMTLDQTREHLQEPAHGVVRTTVRCHEGLRKRVVRAEVERRRVDEEQWSRHDHIMAYGVGVGMDASTFTTRLTAAQDAVQQLGIDALLVTPGADLRYLCGYDAKPLERLTCLIVPAVGDPVLVLPGLERLAAEASPVGALGLPLLPWTETDDAISIVSQHLGTPGECAVDDRMWAEKLLAFQAALPTTRFGRAGRVIHELRMRKDAAEVEALASAGGAIDTVHAQVAPLLRAGRTEREVGRDIAELILHAGHAEVEFVIVGSGPNSASPHHDLSDRVLQSRDVVVVDIGGAMPDGYFSDSTRTYVVDEAPEGFLEEYAALETAQEAARDAVRPGVTCAAVDAAARAVLADAGLGDFFVHRTGHGIGLEAHEEPYIVAGNDRALEPGMAFSIEPGFYRTGRYGARLEDIVVCTESGYRSMNARPRGVVVAGT